MRAAREAGIDFLDDARYDDETGTRTDPDRLVRGRLRRAVPRRRVARATTVVVANKLWWEFWPEQCAAGELEASLGRMGFDHVDLIYCERPPAGLSVDEVVAQAGALIAAGKARAWGLLELARGAARGGRPQRRGAGRPGSGGGRSCPTASCAGRRSRTPTWRRRSAPPGASVVASAVLAGGALSGQVRGGRPHRRGPPGPAASRRSATTPRSRPPSPPPPSCARSPRSLDTAPAALAIAFALSHDSVASVLFGATSPAQIAENVARARPSRPPRRR